jgi:enoyl-CoA hydratase
MAAAASSLFATIERFPRPTIAAVNGAALGGGCELALACDIRIAADTAVFGFPEVGLGIIPAAGATQRLPKIVGLEWAKHLILTAARIDAAQALRIGLVTAVVPSAHLKTAVGELAGQIVRQAPLALRLAKQAVDASQRIGSDGGLLIETLAQALCYGSPDKEEGALAFLEKRSPTFTDR